MFGAGLALSLDEVVYLIATDGSNASYLLPVSFWGGVVVVGLGVAWVVVGGVRATRSTTYGAPARRRTCQTAHLPEGATARGRDCRTAQQPGYGPDGGSADGGMSSGVRQAVVRRVHP